ncbi:ABC transporter ATP-binding protein [Leucobacter triazinivorans]|uniref:ABC transporter ATP-binding protein n=2 Tax=Leucobacter triazinivorans TaxID=1784719 RepID=A0A4P6KJG9_9MICO|nr:ABC transporter ATP-binding protein [Leucobacter triazinivorans]
MMVECENLNLSFGRAQILKDVSLSLPIGRMVGLVGESGSGKSTLARAIVGVHRIDSGRLAVLGEDMSKPTRRQLHQQYRKVQYIPQDPYSSLNPRRTIGETLAEAVDPATANLRRHREEIIRSLEVMGLGGTVLDRYPHQFSGGQRQRIAIVRALLVKPQLIVADEITSALDVSVQAEVVKQLQDLKGSVDWSMVFITHNLAVTQQVCDDVVVMKQGRIVEVGSVERVFRAPESDYTQLLLNSVPGSAGFSLA